MTHFCFNLGSHEDGCDCVCCSCSAKNRQLAAERFQTQLHKRLNQSLGDIRQKTIEAKWALKNRKVI